MILKPKKGYKLVKWLFGKEIEIPEEWGIKKLVEIGEIIGGGTPDSTNKDYWDGKILWAVPTDITKLQFNKIEDTERKITKQGLDNSSAKLLPEETILITSRATVGKCAIATKPISTNQGFQNIICNDDYDNLFIFYSIKHNLNNLLRVSQGTTFLEISKNQIKNVIIPIPNSLHEQQKIVTILSNVDNLINSTQKIIDQTITLKKGLMQKLLTKGIGHKQFKKVSWLFGKEIEIPEDWEIKKLKEVSKVKGGKRLPPGESFSEIKTIHPYLRVVDFRNNTINEKNLKYISNEIFKEIKNYTISSDNVYISIAGTIGLAGLIPNRLNGSNLTENAAKIIVAENIIKNYLSILLNFELIQNQIRSYLGTTSQPKLALFRIEKLELLLPSVAEQQKIASILSGVDAYIQKSQEYKEKLDILKRGLMQKLLTGQIRV